MKRQAIRYSNPLVGVLPGILLGCLLCFSVARQAVGEAPAQVDFTRDVQPILAQCIKCHGPEKQQGGLRFDLRAGAIRHGETDEIGYRAAVDPVTVHDLHATMLHLLGIDHMRLTYLHNGRRYRLTDVAGDVLDKILA